MRLQKRFDSIIKALKANEDANQRQCRDETFLLWCSMKEEVCKIFQEIEKKITGR